jgi:uncharacterized protein
MAKYLLLILVLLAILWIFGWLRWPRAQRKPPPAAHHAEIMVACACCQTHIPQSEAVRAADKYYCCDAHRQQDAAGG